MCVVCGGWCVQCGVCVCVCVCVCVVCVCTVVCVCVCVWWVVGGLAYTQYLFDGTIHKRPGPKFKLVVEIHQLFLTKACAISAVLVAIFENV